MKRFICDFFSRGIKSCCIGPVVLGIIYLIMNKCGSIEPLSADQVAIGIFSLSLLAFIAGGINAVYQIEKLPLMFAIFIHGIILYVCYLITYLLNDWIEFGALHVLVFSIIFVFGFLVIWGIIYLIVSRYTNNINKKLSQKHK